MKNLQVNFKFWPSVYLGFLLLAVSCQSQKYIVTTTTAKGSQYHIADSNKPDSATTAYISNYKNQLDAKMGEIIAISPTTLEKGKPESLLGNFMTDLILDYTRNQKMEADACFINYGGIRASLPKGDITVGNIYELMPFDNELVIVKLNPDQFRQFLEVLAAGGGLPVSGINMKIKDKKYTDVLINGKAYDPTRSYSVVMSDYIANGGDNMAFLKTAERKNMNLKIRDMLIDYTRLKYGRTGIIISKLDGRITKME